MALEVTRREWLRAAGAVALVLPMTRFAGAAIAPSDKLTVALIGVGSQGMRVMLDLLRLVEVQVVAVCDVNRGSDAYEDWGGNELRNKVRGVLGDSSWGERHAGPAAGAEVAQDVVNRYYAKAKGKPGYRGCAAYEDYRELLAKEHDVDAVVVSTPDHWHATIAIAAMRAGKHVYSQKPMAHSLWESREMVRVAKETKRQTAVSIFNAHAVSSGQVRQAIGQIGAVHTIDIWTTRASSFWKQGLPTPTVADAVPASLNWDRWLGPAAMRPYNHVYQPFTWRAWYDFGCGALGDMGEYGLDTIHRAVGLGVPERVDASTSELFPESFPVASAVHFQFAATAKRPAVELNWYDGGMQPKRPRELAATVPMLAEGAMYRGATGTLMTEFMGQNAHLLLPNGTRTELYAGEPKGGYPYFEKQPELGVGAVTASAEHYLDWVRACQGGAPARANYAFEEPIVETLMLGVIAQRTHEALVWDAAEMRFTQGSSRATELLRSPVRAGFEG